MPPVKSTAAKTDFGKAMGADGAEAVIKNRDTDARVSGFVNLPPGVSGIARLTQCSVYQSQKDGDNKGKWFFKAVGSVVEPLTAKDLLGNNMRVKGLQTSVLVGPIEDTPIKGGPRKGEVQSKAEILDRIMNELKLLIGKEAFANATVDDIPQLCEDAVNAAPYFAFATTPRIAQSDDPKNGVKKGDVTGAWENWRGTEGLEDYREEEVQAVGKDNTGPAPANGKAAAAPSGNGKSSSTATVTRPPAAAKPPAKQPDPEPDPTPDPFVPETSDDLDMLLADADSNSDTNQASQQRIADLATAAGITEKEQAKIPTWAGIVDALKAAMDSSLAGGDGGSGDENDEAGLKVGDWVGYFPKDPVTKKKVKDPVRAQVVKLDEEKGLADLKAGKASYKQIALSDLHDDPEAGQ